MGTSPPTRRVLLQFREARRAICATRRLSDLLKSGRPSAKTCSYCQPTLGRLSSDSTQRRTCSLGERCLQRRHELAQLGAVVGRLVPHQSEFGVASEHTRGENARGTQCHEHELVVGSRGESADQLRRPHVLRPRSTPERDEAGERIGATLFLLPGATVSLLADGLIVEPLNGIVDAILFDPLQQALQKGDVAERTRCRGFPPASPFLRVACAQFGYLPITPGGANFFFQLVNARYEKGAMILTSNRGFAEWGEVFGDAVVATAFSIGSSTTPSSYRSRGPAIACESTPICARTYALRDPSQLATQTAWPPIRKEA